VLSDSIVVLNSMFLVSGVASPGRSIPGVLQKMACRVSVSLTIVDMASATEGP
jgi:hypothetical protein